jgi:hypothetical protein
MTVQISGSGFDRFALVRLAVEAKKRSASASGKPSRRASPTPTSPPAPRPSPPAPQSAGHVAEPNEILYFGMVRRAEIDDTAENRRLAGIRPHAASHRELTGTALQIVEAGRKRRGEV